MSESVLASVFGRVFLVPDVAPLARSLGEASQALQLSNAGSTEDTLNRYFSPREYAELREWARQTETDFTDVSALHSILTEARQQLMKLPLMTITVAVRLNRAAALKIVDWLEDSGPGSLKLALSHDPRVVGGAIIEWRGRRHDYSLAAKLSNEYIRTKV